MICVIIPYWKISVDLLPPSSSLLCLSTLLFYIQRNELLPSSRAHVWSLFQCPVSEDATNVPENQIRTFN